MWTGCDIARLCDVCSRVHQVGCAAAKLIQGWLFMNVAVIGASHKPERYSYRAMKMLKEKGHVPFAVHPALKTIDGVPVFAALSGVPGPVDVVTLYVSRTKQAGIADEIVQCRPRRVIFNPGAENPELAGRLRAEGIEVLEACTLVLLKTGQF